MEIKPIGKRVLIKPKEVETKTQSGIFLPDTASKEQPIIGKVVALGSHEDLKDINIGEDVIYSRYSGTEIKNSKDEVEYIILNLDDVLGIVK